MEKRRIRVPWAPLLLGLLIGSAVPSLGQAVPAEFSALYSSLEQELDRFAETVDSQWDGTTHPVTFSAELLTAHASQGPTLIDGFTYPFILMELDQLRALGVQAVRVSIPFPMLSSGFHQTPVELDLYRNFYRRLSGDIRARGMKLAVYSAVMFPEFSDFAFNLQAFYQGLSFEEYKNGRLETARNIAMEMTPDYLDVGAEPDTEARLTGQFVNGPASFSGLISFILDGLVGVGTRDAGIFLGAGVGTWLRNHQLFVLNLALLANLDFISIHTYPVGFDFLDRAFTIADTAHNFGKSVVIDEAWLYKTSELDHLAGITEATAFRRDTFSFWQPLDTKFLQVMHRFSNLKKLEYFSPFWTKYFYNYLNYEDVSHLSSLELIQLSNTGAIENLVLGNITATARGYRDLIAAQAPTDVANFAQFGDGLGLSSSLVLVNSSRERSVSGRVRLFGPLGEPLSVGVNSRLRRGDFTFSVPPLGVGFFDTEGQGEVLTTGSVEVGSNDSIGSTVLFESPSGVAGVGPAEQGTTLLVPIELNSNSLLNTGIALVNPSDEPRNVTLTLRREDGVPVTGATAVELLPARGQLARFPEEVFADSGIDLSQFRGNLEVQSASAIGGIAIRVSPGRLATLPVASIKMARSTLHLGLIWMT